MKHRNRKSRCDEIRHYKLISIIQPTCSSAMGLPSDWISKETWFMVNCARNNMVSFITSRSRVLLRLMTLFDREALLFNLGVGSSLTLGPPTSAATFGV